MSELSLVRPASPDRPVERLLVALAVAVLVMLTVVERRLVAASAVR